MKLHLGCGGTYLDGYVNIDYPTTEQTIMNVRADIYQDITTLSYEEGSIDEIRTHHMFEHFNRSDALFLLARWRRWLKPEGQLVIETPDYFWCSVFYIFAPFKFRMRLGRHVMGSQEADWADHLDFWDKKKFKKVLKTFGFTSIKFSHPIYRNFLPNVTVRCQKSVRSIDDQAVLAEILSWYIVPGEDPEVLMKNWFANTKLPT
ncbi:MAG: hypothetical protein COY70_04565 [Candidatus Magasanikbacteria bacterium CG_4_10_14_0_8_um_filter_42_12]|nr:MAG: hypothetical protein COY70_04565 [Candidatus Magasanikbacteria bacterium CG_4_10_14_0_8_um_filter_42_12]